MKCKLYIYIYKISLKIMFFSLKGVLYLYFFNENSNKLEKQKIMQDGSYCTSHLAPTFAKHFKWIFDLNSLGWSKLNLINMLKGKTNITSYVAKELQSEDSRHSQGSKFILKLSHAILTENTSIFDATNLVKQKRISSMTASNMQIHNHPEKYIYSS